MASRLSNYNQGVNKTETTDSAFQCPQLPDTAKLTWSDATDLSSFNHSPELDSGVP